jgi:hypothetical protein
LFNERPEPRPRFWDVSFTQVRVRPPKGKARRTAGHFAKPLCFNLAQLHLAARPVIDSEKSEELVDAFGRNISREVRQQGQILRVIREAMVWYGYIHQD